MITRSELDLILEYAPRLRAAGIVHVEGVNLLPLEVEDDAIEQAPVPEDEPSPLNDPSTFGRRTSVPMRGSGDS